MTLNFSLQTAPTPTRRMLSGWRLYPGALWAAALFAGSLLAAAQEVSTDQNELASPQQRVRGGPERGVYKARINAHWFGDNKRFWYRNDLADGMKEFIVVDASEAKRQVAFDHDKLAAALSRVAGQEFDPRRLPFSEIEFSDDGKEIRFEAAGKTWRCNLDSFECRVFEKESEGAKQGSASVQDKNQSSDEQRTRRGRRRDSENRLQSPDGAWHAMVK